MVAPAARAGLSSSQDVDWRRLGLLVLVLLAAAAVTALPAAHEALLQIVETVRDVIARHSALGAALFVFVAALSAMLVLFSGAALVPIGVAAFGQTACLLLLWAGWFLGGLATYTIGRYLGRPAVRWIVPAEAFKRYEARVPANATFLNALLLQLMLPSDVVGYFFGLLRFPKPRYVAALLCAELPYALATVLLGTAFVERQFVVLLAVAACAALLALALILRRGISRKDARG